MMVEEKRLKDLIVEWERRARRAFYDAENERDPVGRKLIEHGAICHFNCANELREVLAAAWPVPLAKPIADRKLWLTLASRWSAWLSSKWYHP